MSDWRSRPLASFAALEANAFVDGPFGSNLKVSDYTSTGVRILQLQNLGDGAFINDNVKYTSGVKATALSRCNVRPGDIIIAKMAEPLARACIVPREVKRAVIVADLIKLRPAEDVDPDYLCAAINGQDFRREAERLSTGTTRTRISLSRLKGIALLSPPTEVQAYIGTIVRTIDEAIEQTEALIAKTQQIKAGLMHDLFTRGVTAEGRLRPPREEAPQLYKESPLGWIPKDWGCEGIDCIGTWASGGTPAKAQPEFWGGDIPWVTPKDMKVFRLESTQDTLTPTGAGTGSRVVQKDSVFIVVRGMILAHTFPVCLAIAPMAFNQDVKALVPGSLASGEFLAHWFAANKDYMLGLVTEATHGTKRIDMRDIFRSQIGLPPAREQAEIVHILNEVDAKLEVTRSEAFKLQEMKSGLMQDLLSGAVSVAIEHEPKPKDVAANV